MEPGKKDRSTDEISGKGVVPRSGTPPTDRDLAGRFVSAKIYLPKPSPEDHKRWRKVINEWYISEKLSEEVDPVLSIENRTNADPKYCPIADEFMLKTHYLYEHWKCFREAAYSLKNLTDIIWTARSPISTCKGRLRSIFRKKMPTLPFSEKQILAEMDYISNRIKEEKNTAKRTRAIVEQSQLSLNFMAQQEHLENQTAEVQKLVDKLKETTMELIEKIV